MVTQAEAAAREASFVQAMDSFGDYGPGVGYIASRFGLPMVIAMGTRAADYNGPDFIMYSSLWLSLDYTNHRLSNVTLGKAQAYRYKDTIGIGSTLNEVFAVLGRPVKIVPLSQKVNSGENAVLYTNRYANGHESQEISYRLHRMVLNFYDGKVLYIEKSWK
jgi:hypothetical protein